MIDRDLAYRIWWSNRTDELRNLYRSFRNRVHTLVRTAKRNCMERVLNLNLPVKTLWRSDGSGFDFPAFSFRCVAPKEVFDSIYHIKSDLVGLADGVPLYICKVGYWLCSSFDYVHFQFFNFYSINNGNLNLNISAILICKHR
jgi:hypothetical protein